MNEHEHAEKSTKKRLPVLQRAKRPFIPSRVAKRSMELARQVPLLPDQAKKPKVFADCERQNLGTSSVPCPWISCWYHLAVERKRSGSLVIHAPFVESDDGVPELDVRSMPETCALRAAAKGPHTLEAIASFFGVTRERIRQSVEDVLERTRDQFDEELW